MSVESNIKELPNLDFSVDFRFDRGVVRLEKINNRLNVRRDVFSWEWGGWSELAEHDGWALSGVSPDASLNSQLVQVLLRLKCTEAGSCE